MQSAIDHCVIRLPIRRDVARRNRRQTLASYLTPVVFAVWIATFAFGLALSEQASADGGLEAQEGGLFHSMGWVAPEIPRRKAARRRINKRMRTRASRVRRSASNSKPRVARKRIPRAVVERSDQEIARATRRAIESLDVASLTTTVPISRLITGPEISIPEDPLNIRWIASSGCLALKLRVAINHIARNYGQVQVNSTCRSRRHNRLVGGARHSYHIGGRAADIRVRGNVRSAARYLRRLSGGYKYYGGGLFHIDTGPKRTW